MSEKKLTKTQRDVIEHRRAQWLASIRLLEKQYNIIPSTTTWWETVEAEWLAENDREISDLLRRIGEPY
jgi:hypothetical protein